MLKTNLRQHIVIDAMPAKVWKVLTSPHYLRQYLFEGDIDCVWKEGSPLLWSASLNNGKGVPRGNVLQVIPEMLLKYSLSNHGLGEFTSTFELAALPGGVQLNLHCEGCSGSGEEYLIRLQQVKLLLQKIKWLAEYA